MFRKNVNKPSSRTVMGAALGAALVVSLFGGQASAQTDDEFILAEVDFNKSVYQGHNSGGTCGESSKVTVAKGTKLTYCYTVKNVSGAGLDNLRVDDEAFSSPDALSTFGDDTILNVGESVQYYVEVEAPEASVNSEALLSAEGLNDAGEVAFGFSARSSVEVEVAGGVVEPVSQSASAAPPEILGERPNTSAATTSVPAKTTVATTAKPTTATTAKSTTATTAKASPAVTAAAKAETTTTVGVSAVEPSQTDLAVEAGEQLAMTGPREVAIVSLLGLILSFGGLGILRRLRTDAMGPALVNVAQAKQNGLG